MALVARVLALALWVALSSCSAEPAPAPAEPGRPVDLTEPEEDAGPASDGGAASSMDATVARDAGDAHADAKQSHDARAARDTSRPPLEDAPARVTFDVRAPRADGGATSLSLSLPLVPAFSPSIYDYYVRCARGGSSITITMRAAAGSLIGLVPPSPTTTVPASASAVTLDVSEGAALVAEVTSDAGATQYWVRCLPSDFATFDLELHPDAGEVTPGYYLVGDLSGNAPVDAGYAMALDTHGVPVWYQRSVSGIEPIDVESVVPGTISFNTFPVPTCSTAAVGEFEIHDLAAGTTAMTTTVGTPLDLHELRALSNGDYLMLSDPVLTDVDLTGLEAYGASEDMLGCLVQEVDPTTRTPVWEWNALNHLDPVKDCTVATTKTIGSVVAVEPFHCNSVDVDDNGDLVVSVKNMNTVVLVSRATGDILWKMGGSSYTIEDAPYLTVTDDPGTSFYRQHDVRVLPDGTISMFDDHTGAPGTARAVIYQLDLVARTATMAWQYVGASGSNSMGSFRLLADGSRTIGWGESLGPLSFSEVSEAGDDLLDFRFTDHHWTYRAIKIPTSAFDIGTLRAATGAFAGRP